MEGEPAVFILTRDGGPFQELAVGVAIGGTLGLATHENRVVVFPEGASTTEFEVATVDNEVDRLSNVEGIVLVELSPPETFGLPPNYHGNNDQSSILVKDNEYIVVTVSAPVTNVIEGEDVVFKLRRSGYAGNSLSADIRITGGGNFITGEQPTTATFERYSSVATVTLTTENDAAVDEYDEVTLEVLDNVYFDPGDPSSATVSVFDSIGAFSSVSILANSAVVDEGEDVMFTLARTGAGLDEPLTVQVDVVDISWDPTHDRNLLLSGRKSGQTRVEVAFEAGSPTATLTRATVDETENDGNSKVTASIALGRYGINPYPGTAQTWVKDDDIPTVNAHSAYVARLATELYGYYDPSLTDEEGAEIPRPPVETGFEDWIEDASQWPGVVFLRTGGTTDSLFLDTLGYSIAWWPGRLFVHSGGNHGRWTIAREWSVLRDSRSRGGLWGGL